MSTGLWWGSERCVECMWHEASIIITIIIMIVKYCCFHCDWTWKWRLREGDDWSDFSIIRILFYYSPFHLTGKLTIWMSGVLWAEFQSFSVGKTYHKYRDADTTRAAAQMSDLDHLCSRPGRFSKRKLRPWVPTLCPVSSPSQMGESGEIYSPLLSLHMFYWTQNWRLQSLSRSWDELQVSVERKKEQQRKFKES